MRTFVSYEYPDGTEIRAFLVDDDARGLFGDQLKVGGTHSASFDKSPGDDARVFKVVSFGEETHPKHGRVYAVHLRKPAN
jgi:hypothetical protein